MQLIHYINFFFLDCIFHVWRKALIPFYSTSCFNIFLFA